MSANYLRSCQTLYAETGIDDAPLRSLGTVFYATYRGRGIALTAKHVVAGESPDTLSTLATDQGDVVTFEALAVPVTGEDWADLAILLIGQDEPTSWIENAVPITEETVARGGAPQAGDRLYLAGMPSEHRSIRYDGNTVDQTRFFVNARHLGPDDERGPLQSAEILDDLPLSTYNGFSGSPLLMATPRGIGFTGIVIQGHPSSRRIHYVPSGVVLRALEAADPDFRSGAG
jgi:hypothetical protein